MATLFLAVGQSFLACAMNIGVCSVVVWVFFWLCLVLHGCVWLCLVLSSHAWLCLGAPDCFGWCSILKLPMQFSNKFPKKLFKVVSLRTNNVTPTNKKRLYFLNDAKQKLRRILNLFQLTDWQGKLLKYVSTPTFV